MPRGSFKHEEAQQGGFGFQEGNLLITKSVVAVHQLPPNSKTGEQSAPFTCLRWTGVKLDSEWNEIDGEAPVVLAAELRLGNTEQVRPGKLDAKDFDNLDVEPEDLGDEVDTEGNAVYLVEGAKLNRSWAIMEESLRKYGFKPEISGRGIATDFEGMTAHFKTVEGQKYIAKKGAKAGQEVTPTNLVVDRIHTYPYDAKKKAGKAANNTATSTAAGKSSGTASASAAASGSHGPNGTAGVSVDDGLDAAKAVFGNLSAEFKKEIPADKEVKRADFQKALTKELMRQKVKPQLQKQVMDVVKDDDKLMELAGALMEAGGNGQFVVGDGTVSFQ
jgi:hypothetical protein